jgi:hypothetical protein
MCWHWESYVDRNNLWYHFGRFSEVVKGINPRYRGLRNSIYGLMNFETNFSSENKIAVLIKARCE